MRSAGQSELRSPAGPAAAATAGGDRLELPDLGGAPSTTVRRAGEERLLRRHLSPLAGRRVLATGLWNEARGSRILRWAAGRGAIIAGVDGSPAIARQAACGFGRRHRRLLAAVADLRHLPWADASFDAVWALGTVEHLADPEAAAGELRRVLRPGGLAVLGVPNRWDPFLRPLLVALLSRLGLYGYPVERSYSRPALAALCRRAGFELVAEDGMLFLPGKLRLLDLLLWVRARPLSRLSGLMLRPFVWLERRFPRLRRHGYLIVAVARRPAA